MSFTAWSFTAMAASTQRDPAPIDDTVIQQLVQRHAVEQRSAAADGVERQLNEIDAIVRNAPGAPDGGRMLLAGTRRELGVVRTQALSEFAATRLRLLDLGLNDQVAAWDKLKAQADARFTRLDRALAAHDVANRSARARALGQIEAELKSLRGGARQWQPDSGPLPTYRQDVPPPFHEMTPSQQAPAYLASDKPGSNMYAFAGDLLLLAAAPATPAEAASCGYSAADLAATPDAPQTPEIQALAAQLGYSPARIFEYVSNTVQFQPY